MIDRICFKCEGYVNDVWTLVLYDDKEKIEFSGCKEHVDELDNKIKSIKDSQKKSVKQIIKEINYKEGNHVS